MEFIKLVLALAVSLGILVSFHEFGHFIVARAFGIKVVRFSIGFGKVIWSKIDKKGTEFAISVIPLGGYVSMLDDEIAKQENIQISDAEKNQLFSSKPVWARFLVISAGPVFNFILALAVFWLLYFQPYYQIKPIIGEVQNNSIAQKADLRPLDKIISINSTSVESWQDVFLRLASFAGETQKLEFVIEREDYQISKNLGVENFLNSDEKNPLKLLGFSEYIPPQIPIVDQVLPDSPALFAGLQTGDLILQIDDQKIKDWQEVVDLVQASPNKKLNFFIKRGSTNLNLEILPKGVEKGNGALVGQIGAGVKLQDANQQDEKFWRKIDNSATEAFAIATKRTWDMSVITLESIGKIIKGVLAPDNISGPISIAKMAYNSANLGWKSFLQFLAVVSISLGVLNILPIPMLDGGQLVFLILEGVGIKISTKLKTQVNMIGFALLMTITAMAIYFDILRL